jgi:PAS domain S-box-containing protein
VRHPPAQRTGGPLLRLRRRPRRRDLGGRVRDPLRTRRAAGPPEPSGGPCNGKVPGNPSDEDGFPAVPGPMHHDRSQLEQRWSLAVQNAGFGVWDLDVRSDTVHYPPQWKALLGYVDTDEPDPTATWRGRVHPDDLSPMLAALTGHLAGRRPTYEIEFRLRGADGAYRWVLSRGRVVERDADGQALRAVGTLTDVTVRREVERLLAERERARIAQQLRAELLGRVSHELRTPLNAVLGFSQLLSRRIGGEDVEDQRRYAELVERAGWRLLRMVDDVLDLRHAAAGQLTSRREAVVLAPLVHDVLQTMTPLAHEHAVRLMEPSVPPQATVRGDAARLRQVLEKLMDNGIRYNRRGGSVRIEVGATPGAGWQLAVIDTGMGIPQARIPQLFEPFKRMEGGGGGAGVSLALSQSLMETMEGALTVRSTEGVGSIFELTLPPAEAATG